jgi:hypothetical protein
MLPFLTLDKSFLQGCTSIDLAAQACSHRFVLPEALVYEVAKHPPEVRSKLFRKFPSGPEPYTVAHDISRMLRDEMASKRPYSHENIDRRDLSIHDDLASMNFELTSSMTAAIEKRRQDVEEDSQLVIKLAATFLDLHPHAFQGSATTQAEAQSAIKLEIISETYVKKRYADAIWMRHSSADSPVLPSMLSAKWVNFRWFQVFGLLAWDVITRYRDLHVILSSPGALEKLKHDVLDSQALLTALAVGGDFAMQERKWRPIWELLNPEGAFVSKT